ncbi:MAG: hypothetical protein HKL81_05215 [Acidimicrobiaceae bacterium]|nr:hypothetical protein [Acidimicrobiaceae bacterium]
MNDSKQKVSQVQRSARNRSKSPLPSHSSPGVTTFADSQPTQYNFLDNVGEWGFIAARVLLGIVLLWFGYHELVVPGLWTGYVPIISQTSHLAQILVLTHGWILTILAVSLIFGIAPRLASLLTAILMVEIIITLVATAGLSDLVLRDVGVLGLALALLGRAHNRLVLTN